MDGAFIARQERVYAAVAVAAGVLERTRRPTAGSTTG
jgi:hypothetical protein